MILAGNDVFLDENITEELANTVGFDRASNLKSIRRMKQLAATPALIVPGPDPAVFQKFPSCGPNIVRIQPP